ncbi:type II toxin-antitoxin system VapC family toxin [Rhizobium leguminosarum]|uniref:type II toxin-antitoxin system VapC family toxin n=1 Tax=Rhizobium/Agrobacterium group TaxID=227290 RepID=UPI0006215FC8|nr:MULTISPECIES: type II toxin-antitoxin system VapC family toxin [Rhizobium/Agrobacterium group]MBY3173791.1 type II toxin-antitoxin system VapC family toxin [Rhizobium leguminosarum]MBY5540710.1 type II toxin-antitoxin system VapC family toxin [Rhizobium leguminosarum]MBY5609271.1 type II toxin-antitoxin system VapC family toxin [Rhizobium leguminosarum]MBY5641485.1 type II toxin-antitoxin system VapC family toxin [Rhizobium leguminosarum]MBY5657024.1 type II toxin-antitoxin system VapC fami
MFLVDTNVISALAPSKRQSSGQLVEWLDKASSQLFLSVISAAEVKSGIAKAERDGATTKAQRLKDWWESIEYLYAQKLLPFDLRCAHAAGRILDDARAHQPGFEDIAIAATAKVHGLTVLTRNMRHFGPLGVQVLDPFEALPEL